eukprot:CAMPEP_0172306786 /NCGR_PEP_ID=MMETSP1058-20130122/7784_1 /TAXON_ID=83371 /ORGANISM="Detonula confervacea, Strain CCMP 353" /LENGTH=526 /DNA_ID=CAMNT_0013018779 /DNA_START=12 /DNA_END=1592 /DNA_ORIENTATION=+
MAPFKAAIDEESADDDEGYASASTTHHSPLLRTIKEESMDETSTTRHEPLSLVQDDDNMKEEEEAYAAARARVVVDKQHDTTGGAHDGTLRLNRKVAEIAAKAYRRASAQSNVLSRAKLADIALVRFDEMEIGKFLGKGSFSNVHEITKVTASGKDGDDESCDGKDEGAEEERPTAVGRTTVDMWTQVANPRKLLTMHHQRSKSGTYRYAIKFLKEEIRSNPQKYAIGTSDLVIEGMFLASLAHPNIIKVRGLPEGGVKSLINGSRSHGYFLILDRLFDTLSERVYGEWKGGHLLTLKKKFGFLSSKKEKEARNTSLAVRLKVAFDISAALKFLHSKCIIYRDLKPENLGFDVRGDIKLFDLGLVKELHPNAKDRNGNYKLSMAGTPRYMSPECGMYQPYNLSADVYSFSMLLWEILTLEKPLKDYTYTRLKNEIFIDGERPKIGKVFNKKMRVLVASGWSQNPNHRPSIDRVYEELKSEYLKLAPGKLSEGQLSHNRRRSTFVAQQINTQSVRRLMRLNSDLNSS